MKTSLSLLAAILSLSLLMRAAAQSDATQPNVSGVFPHLALVADHAPRTEAGVGALMPWANRLWTITYTAHMAATGAGTGLYEIDERMQMRKRPESVVGTYANRMIHGPSDQLIIGPHFIDTAGHVRTAEALVPHRLTATAEHLTDPKNKVYFLAMEGELFEADVRTLAVTQLFDLKKELEVPPTSKPHFKGAFTHAGRVVIANNTYNEDAYTRAVEAGRLAEWDGKTWTILERTAFVEIGATKSFGKAMWATGWDHASVILKVFAKGAWSTYRLPKGGQAWDETSTTEWMRIREVETERALMDVHGIFYELPYHSYEGRIWGLRPICTHLRVIPDFCSWRGMLVLGGNQATPMRFADADRNPNAGQPQAGLWFGKTDDLWSFGKPRGSGGVWRDTAVKAGEPSVPFLMNGFDKKVVHLRHTAGRPVKFKIEIDFLGNGTWAPYETVTVPETGYRFHTFPDGFSAEWIRVTTDADCTATAFFIFS